MGSLSIIEVETIFALRDVDGILVSTVLQDELLEVQEGSLVRHLLTQLYLGLPGVLGCQPGTVWTLTILNDVLDFERLLENRRGEDLLLYRQLDPEPLGVRFCPDEAGIDEPDFIETSQLS